MAWNEPGGGKPKDPWGGGDQGPPDLDEALKKFQEKINSLFGGKKSGGPSSSASAPSGGLFGILAIGVLALYFAFGFYQVDEQERAVVLRLGKYHDTVSPGLRWNWPLIDNVKKVNVTFKSVGHHSVMLTQDENIVDITISVQYLITDPKSYLFRVRQPEMSLEQAMESALRHVVGGTEMDQIITEGRGKIALDVQKRLQQYLDAYQSGMQISVVNVESTRAPAAVQEAFDDVKRATEDRERLKNEAETYANGVIPEARGRAQRQIEEANAYRAQVVSRAEGEATRFEKLLGEYRKAPEVTRQRLYIDALQSVYSNSNKILVDVPGGNNMLYVPLDKILEQQNAAGHSASTSSVEVQADPAPPLRRDAFGREGR